MRLQRLIFCCDGFAHFQLCVCVSTLTSHGEAVAPRPALILTQLSVHFGLGCSSGGRRQVRITQLPEEERRRSSKLLLGG